MEEEKRHTSSSGWAAPGRKVQAPPLPKDVQDYGRYLEAYEQFLFAEAYLADIEKRLRLSDPALRLRPTVSLSTVGLAFRSPAISVGSVSTTFLTVSDKITHLRNEKKVKGKAPAKVVPPPPADAPPVTMPPPSREPRLAPGSMSHEEYNALDDDAQHYAAMRGLYVLEFSDSEPPTPEVIPVPLPVPTSLPSVATSAAVPKTVSPEKKQKKAAAKKARSERRKAKEAAEKLAAMSAKELKEDNEKNRLLAQRLKLANTPLQTSLRSVLQTSGRLDTTQMPSKKTPDKIRKRSPSYMRRLAKRQLARYSAKP